ncbi:hypothetical protein IF1G_10492 [Cordyceps javanica]|uniref:Uncharacterized protein n=1 Tax=Cordyceps javanica TaxID=43265 RepID=A0A545UMQ9_9HYPO|nr:hypothetical protein IF1G_10492 [Cordyceps javanica]
MSYHDVLEYLTPLGRLVDHNSGALICCHEKCKRAIPVEGGQPSTHLASYHRVPIAARVELTRLPRKLVLHNPEKLTPLEDGSTAHPSLRLYDGYIGRNCDTRTADATVSAC